MLNKILEVFLKIKVQSSDAEQALKAIQLEADSAKEAVSEIGNAPIPTDSVDKLKDSVEKTGKEADKAGKKIDDSFKGVKSIAGDATSAIDGMTGGLVSGFKNGVSGIKSGISALRTFKGIVAAAGIGLLVVAVASLVEYFKNFEAGVKLVEKAMNVLNAVIGQLTASFQKLLSGDFKGFISGVKDLGKAASDAAKNTDKLYEANSRIAEIVLKNTSENAELNRQLELSSKILRDGTKTYEERVQALKDIEEAEKQLIENEKELVEVQKASLSASLANENNELAQKKLKQQIAELDAKLLSSKTALEIKSGQANKKIRELDAQRSDEAQAQAEKRLQIERKFQDDKRKLAEEIELLNISDEQERELKRLQFSQEAELRAVADAEFSETKKSEIRLQILEKFKLQEAAINKKFSDQAAAAQKVLDEKEAAEKKAIADNLIDLEVQLLKLRASQTDTLLDNAEAEVIATQYKYDALIQQAIKNGEDITLLEELKAEEINVIRSDAFEAEEKRLDKLAEQEEQLKDHKIKLASEAIGAIGSLFKEGSKVAKGFAVSQAIIDTYGAANAAFRTASANPITVGFPAYPFVQAGLVVAAGLANVKRILSTKEGSSDGGGSAPSAPVRPSVPSAPRIPGLSNITNPTVNQIGASVAGQMSQQPVRAFVSQRELNTSAEFDRLNSSAARL
jgi:hypothetical protein